jgi:type I restriction enzyme M protein
VLTQSSTIIQRVWNYCNVLRDDGISYGDYVEQLTYLLFLKMDHESATMLGKPSAIPPDLNWASLLKRDGDDLEAHYVHILNELGKGSGLIPTIFRKAQNKIQDPAKLKRLLTLIDGETWIGLGVDVKGEIYEGLLEKNAQDTKSGAGQYFTPRPLIQAMVDVTQPAPGQTICDPACGTGGFLLAAHDSIVKQFGPLDKDQIEHLNHQALHGWEIVDNTARLCVMNLYLHGIGTNGGTSPIHVDDSLAADPGERFDMVLTNPPFGKKSSVTYVTEEGEIKRESTTVVRDDFWASTSNKQLNFVQHVRTLLKIHGKAAVVVPDNVLFEGGAGEIVRRRLLHECEVHTLLRLPTGIFYAQGVKANVLFFDRKPASETPWTRQLWIYDLRTNMNFTLKTAPLARVDLDEFVTCYHPENRHDRQATWSEENPQGRWRVYSYEELAARDKVNLDIFWLRDESLEDSANLPEPDVLAAEIVEELEVALEQFRGIVEALGESSLETVDPVNNRPILLGAIAGDMIGSRFEHHAHKSTDFELFTERSQFTDDTVLTIAVADAILNNRAYKEALLGWGRRYPHSGFGGAFRDWLQQEDPDPYNSFGNGSAMRVSAVGWAFDTAEEVLKQAEASAAPSHNHPEGIKGAQATALGVFLARKGWSKEDIRDEISSRFGYDLSRSVDEIRPGYRFDVTCQGTLPAALVAFLDSESFEGAIRLAISLGGDADTLAAITGAIAEAFYGGVPEEIMQEVKTRLPKELWGVVDVFGGRYG